MWALYKGEELLATGTLIQIAKELGVKYRTIYFYTTDAYKKRIKGSKNRREIVKL